MGIFLHPFLLFQVSFSIKVANGFQSGSSVIMMQKWECEIGVGHLWLDQIKCNMKLHCLGAFSKDEAGNVTLLREVKRK